MSGELCAFCGDEYIVDLLEFWTEERAWMFDACCEAAHEELCEMLARDLEGAREWVRELFADYGYPIRRVYASESEMALRVDFGLELRDISLVEAKAFIGEHHRHNAPPVSWRWGHAVYNGHELIAVAMVGRPVARMIDASKVVEVNRLCVNHELDSELTWKACSMLYTAAAKEAERRGFEKVITYTLETEAGTSLRYARWKPEHTTRAQSWNRGARKRTDKAPTCRKIRWARHLKPVVVPKVDDRREMEREAKRYGLELPDAEPVMQDDAA